MGEKPKTGKTARKKNKVALQKEQSARFIEAARKSGVDGDGKDFEQAMATLARKRKRVSP